MILSSVWILLGSTVPNDTGSAELVRVRRVGRENVHYKRRNQMAKTQRINDGQPQERPVHAPKTRDEIVEENRRPTPISNSREKMLADSAATRGQTTQDDPNEARVSEFEELAGRSSNKPPSRYARFTAYGLLAFGILIMVMMIVSYAS